MCRREKWKLFFLLILVGISLMPGAPVAGVNKRPTSLAERIEHEALPVTTEGWREWYLEDKAYLQISSPFLYKKEIKSLTKTLQQMIDRPDYRDRLGFAIYFPRTTGGIHLLSAAVAARQDNGTVYPFDQLLGHTLTAEPSSQYPDPIRVIRALKGLKIPREALAGFHIYLLPYSMGEANGYGGNGYAFLAATPDGMALIPNQLEVTLVHEFGHYLSFRFMNRNTAAGRDLWKDYLKIRGISWSNPGEVGSKAWAASSEEVFAEDFRVWVGAPVVGSGYFGDLAYPEPDKKKGRMLANFFRTLPQYPPAKAEDPWLNTGNTLINEMPIESTWLVGAAGFLGLTAATVLAGKKAASLAAQFRDR